MIGINRLNQNRLIKLHAPVSWALINEIYDLFLNALNVYSIHDKDPLHAPVSWALINEIYDLFLNALNVYSIHDKDPLHDYVSRARAILNTPIAIPVYLISSEKTLYNQPTESKRIKKKAEKKAYFWWKWVAFVN